MKPCMKIIFYWSENGKMQPWWHNPASQVFHPSIIILVWSLSGHSIKPLPKLAGFSGWRRCPQTQQKPSKVQPAKRPLDASKLVKYHHLHYIHKSRLSGRALTKENKLHLLLPTFDMKKAIFFKRWNANKACFDRHFGFSNPTELVLMDNFK